MRIRNSLSQKDFWCKSAYTCRDYLDKKFKRTPGFMSGCDRCVVNLNLVMPDDLVVIASGVENGCSRPRIRGYTFIEQYCS